jgi:glycosyltransferase involved in cell wall biosynthesis
VSALAVGLNLLHVTDRSGGMHTYARELVPALLRADPGAHLTAFVARDVARDLREADWAGDVEWIDVPVSWTYDRPWNPLAVAGAQWAGLPWQAARHRLDVLHGLAGIGPPVAGGRTASVVTVHDAIWMRFPHTMSRRATLAMRTFVPLGARRAARVIALSRAARRDVIAQLGLDPVRVEVVAHGAAEPGPAEAADEVRRALDLADGRVIACIAQLLPHKNLESLVGAAAQLPPDVTVVFVGAPTPYEHELRAAAERMGVRARVRFAGWLPQARLEGLYALATAVVLPSFDEGFGLPALEAMRRGVPLVCSDIPALRELTEGSALLFDPYEPERLREALLRVLEDEDLRAESVRVGRERAHAHTWGRAAEETLEVYRRASRRRAY